MKSKVKLYTTVYQTKAPDYEAIIEKAKYLQIKLEFGGGRKTRGGESPNAQITFNLSEMNSKISLARTGTVIVYYPSKAILEKSLVTLLSCYVPPIARSDLKCQGPYNPLSKAFVLKTTENFDGEGNTLTEATVIIHQWLDPKTGEYTFVMPNEDGRIVAPSDPTFEYAGNAGIRIKSINKDDEKGNRIVTGERIRWQAMQELERMCRDHKLTQQDLKRAAEKPVINERKGWDTVDLFFEIL
jgi:hypothetical protein